MESIKIIHTGDLHLCSPLTVMGEKAFQRNEEMLETFENIANLAKREGADALLIAGDMFDGVKPNPHTVQRVCDIFTGIPQVKVFIVLGNHDYGFCWDFPENVYVFKNYIEKISIENVDIYGVSFDSEHCSGCIIEGLQADSDENINLLLVHGDMQQNSLYNPITAECLKFSKMDYVALGHIHAHTGFEKAGATTYAYCGIPEGRGFDECGEKGVVLAEVGKGYANCSFVPVCKRQYLCKNIDVSNCKDNLQIIDCVKSFLEGRDDIYKIILTGDKNTFVDCDFIKSHLEKEFYHVEIEDTTTDISTDGDYSLKTLFKANCHNPDALKYGLSALRGEKVVIE